MRQLWTVNVAVAAACVGIGALVLADGSLWGLADLGGAGIQIPLVVINYKRIRRINGRNRGTEAREGAEHMGTASGSPASTDAAPSIGAVPLESVERAEPIRAWRGVQILANSFTVYLGSMNHQLGNFAADEQKAVCGVHRYFGMYPLVGQQPVEGHEAPGLNCECGFYGVKKKADAYGAFVAEADFYGTVIEHELGYRAEYQRILSIRVVRPALCAGRFLCDGTPGVITFAPDTMTPNSYGGMETLPGSASIVCDRCAADQDRVATLPQLAARLGVEVRWDT